MSFIVASPNIIISSSSYVEIYLVGSHVNSCVNGWKDTFLSNIIFSLLTFTRFWPEIIAVIYSLTSHDVSFCGRSGQGIRRHKDQFV
jgi:hypothetical protein